MKRITLVGAVIFVLAVIVSLVTAMNMGEKSPKYVEGRVELSGDFNAESPDYHTLFIIAFDGDSPTPMPYGAIREKLGVEGFKGPMDFALTKERLLPMMVNPDSLPPRSFRLKARLDRDGNAGPDQPGDLVGTIENIPMGATNVVITINRRIE